MTDRFAAFRHLSYSRYFTSRFFTAFAAQIVSVSVAWQIYDETQNPIYLGWIGLVQFLPALLLVFVTGLASDTFGRRLVMGLSILVEMGCARAFLSPASASLAVNVVPREDFANAVGWTASAWQMASIIGPVVGSLLYGVAPWIAYSTAVILFAVAATLIFSIPKPPQSASSEPKTLSMVLGGFTYIWKQKIVLGAISLDLFAVLLGGAVALMPVYARDILQVGETGLGLMRAAPGIGALIVTGLITAFPIRDHAGIILFVCVALFGLSTTVFGHSTVAWLSILALVCVGAFDMVSVYIREVLLQLWTPDQVRGRVNAVNSIFLGASNELGEARAGFMAAKWGAVFTVVAGGYAAVGVAAAWSAMFPGIRRARNLHTGNPDT